MPDMLLAFIITSIAVELTPGPNMAYLAILGLSRGRVAGLSAVAGVATGLLLLGAIVALGLDSWIIDNRPVYETLRWAGAAYLCWLAYEAWRDGRRPLAPEATAHPLRVYYQRGFLTNLLNPKAALFYVAVVPPYVTPSAPVWPQLSVLVVTYVIVATTIHGLIVLLASVVRPLLDRPQYRRVLGAMFAALLVGVAVWLLVKTA